jgi:alpha-tubulin suppressor-like RCC1 family protein
MTLGSYLDLCSRSEVEEHLREMLEATCPFIHSNPIEVPMSRRAPHLASGSWCLCTIEGDQRIRCLEELSRDETKARANREWSCEPEQTWKARPLRQLDYGLEHGCFVTEGGEPACWGANAAGQLGNGGRETTTSPVRVTSLADVAEIRVGRAHTCARTELGAVYCWGANEDGQLGRGGTDSTTPVRVASVTDALRLAVGAYHACVIRQSGGIACWGRNDEGQTDAAPGTPEHEPQRVAGVHSAKSVATGERHTCVAHDDGRVECWGANDHGELGDGGRIRARIRPLRIKGLEPEISSQRPVDAREK